MNENKKSVKRVLVLDDDSIEELIWVRGYTEDLFFTRMVSLLRGEQDRYVGENPDDWFEERLADLFWKAYGKEVEE